MDASAWMRYTLIALVIVLAGYGLRTLNAKTTCKTRHRCIDVATVTSMLCIASLIGVATLMVSRPTAEISGALIDESNMVTPGLAPTTTNMLSPSVSATQI